MTRITILKTTITHWLCLSLCLPLTACALSGKALHGQVLEEGTRQPLEGAIVVVRWEGYVSLIVDSQSVCVHVESAFTDAQGHYRTPAWSARSTVGPSIMVSDLTPVITAYRPGYVFVSRPSEKNTVWLTPLKGTPAQQLRTTAGAAVTCSARPDIEKPLLPLYRQLYEEARPLVITKEDKKIISDLLFLIEKIALPYDEAANRNTNRLNTIDHEK